MQSGMTRRQRIFQDWSVNPEGKSQFVLAFFRLAQMARWGQTPLPRLLERVIDRSYRWFVPWFLAADIHPDCEIGPGLSVFHMHAVVINPAVRIGARCTLRASTCLGTIPREDGDSDAPVVGDDVDVGVGALIIGPVTVGDGARIGAGAVVVRDVAPGSVAAGNPAHRSVARD
jgi:putative colanic acid biosynthesis acetyltransferase WcaB